MILATVTLCNPKLINIAGLNCNVCKTCVYVCIRHMFLYTKRTLKKSDAKNNMGFEKK